MLVTGSGTSGAVATRAAHLLSVCGTPAFFLPPADGLHGGLGVLQPNDLLLALSKGGSSDELNEFCRRAKSLCRGVVAVTAAPDSTLAAIADHVICMTLADDADLGDGGGDRQFARHRRDCRRARRDWAGRRAITTGNASSSPTLRAQSDARRCAKLSSA